MDAYGCVLELEAWVGLELELIGVRVGVRVGLELELELWVGLKHTDAYLDSIRTGVGVGLVFVAFMYDVDVDVGIRRDLYLI